MNLRNKKTGETGYYLHTHRDHNTGTLKVAVLKDGVPFSEFKPHEPIYDYDSLAELNDEWEDYKPKEPLIKDEKIRRAVRAWAEANRVAEARYSSCHDAECEFNARDDENKSIVFIGNFTEMNKELDYSGRTIYTIAELCGEEEE